MTNSEQSNVSPDAQSQAIIIDKLKSLQGYPLLVAEESPLTIRVSDESTNASLSKFLNYISADQMREDASVDRYTRQLEGYFQRVNTGLSNISKKIDEYNEAATNAINNVKSHDSNDHSTISKVIENRKLISKIKIKIDNLKTLFSDEDNFAELVAKIRPVAYYYEQDSKGVFSTLLQRKWMIAAAVLSSICFVVYANYQKLILNPGIAYILAYPLIALLSSLAFGHYRRNRFVDAARQRVVDAISVRLGHVTPAGKARQLPGAYNSASTLSMINEIEAVAASPQEISGQKAEQSPPARPAVLDMGKRTYGDPGRKSFWREANRVAVTVLGALFFLAAPEIFARASLKASQSGRAQEMLFLAHSNGREACALARGRVFLQTPSRLFVQSTHANREPSIRVIRRDEIVQTRYDSSDDTAIEDCATVKDLYKPQLPPTTVTAPNVFNFLPPDRSAAAVPAVESKSVAIGASPQRVIVIPFLVGAVDEDLKHKGKYSPQAAYLHGFNSVVAGRHADRTARIAVDTLHEAFNSCGRAGGRVTIDVVGYASNRAFDGATPEENEIMNLYLSEGRRAGVIVGLGAGNFQLPSFASSAAPERSNAAGLSVKESSNKFGFKFANYGEMKRHLASWLGEASDSKGLPRAAEAFARSIVVSFDEDDLRDCAKPK